MVEECWDLIHSSHTVPQQLRPRLWSGGFTPLPTFPLKGWRTLYICGKMVWRAGIDKIGEWYFLSSLALCSSSPWRQGNAYAGLRRSRRVQLWGGGRQAVHWKLPWNYIPPHPSGSPPASTVSVATLLQDEAKCHGANIVHFCVLHSEVIWHGLGASYLPASWAQEFLSRVLAGPGKVMKYMKAQCFSWSSSLQQPLGPSRSLNFDQH